MNSFLPNHLGIFSINGARTPVSGTNRPAYRRMYKGNRQSQSQLYAMLMQKCLLFACVIQRTVKRPKKFCRKGL